MEPRDRNKTAGPEEEAALRRKLAEGGPLICPRCQGPLHANPVPPRSDVAYVRNRVILDCESCEFRVVLDRK